MHPGKAGVATDRAPATVPTRSRIKARRLCAAELLETALRRARRHDFADRSFAPGLEHLLAACDHEAHLSLLGLHALRVDVLRSLRNVLQFDAIEATTPAVLSRPIQAPVFITGMPRSGTTFLHRLILQDPGTIAPRLFQLLYPYASRRHKRWVALQLAGLRMIAPRLNALHALAANAPEECTDITAQVFESLRFDGLYRVPSYVSWLERHGYLAAYRFHRRFLQHLDCQFPGRRWILKAPDHVFALDDLRTVYPDAHLVFIHRDPVRVLASVARLTEVLRRPFTRRIDRAAIGHDVSASWLNGAQRMMRLSSSGRDTALHLFYRQVLSSPMDAVRAVYRHCGLELTAQAERRMQAWLRSSANVRAPRHYELADFGLDAHQLRERFASYTNTFDLEIEPV